MEKRRNFIDHLKEQTIFHPESVPGYPIVEIAGTQRVLIENHKGIAEYRDDQILVKVPFGTVCVCGYKLEILRMTKEQLIICGCIHSVGLQRRK